MAELHRLHIVPEDRAPEDRASDDRASDPTLTIDCEVCVGLGTSACDDCVVSYVIGSTPGDGLRLDRDEARQLDLLADAGLAPVSHFRPRHDVA